jgi:hypothetical protein
MRASYGGGEDDKVAQVSGAIFACRRREETRTGAEKGGKELHEEGIFFFLHGSLLIAYGG